jgi:hypothetical protein
MAAETIPTIKPVNAIEYNMVEPVANAITPTIIPVFTEKLEIK